MLSIGSPTEIRLETVVWYHLMTFIGFWSVASLLLSPNFIGSHASDQSYSDGGPKRRFENGFNSKCSKYPFVAQYLANLQAPSQRFIIFVYHEAGVNNGGLGDRLGGMISAIAYALRTGRTLLISGDKAFEESFQPYHPQNNGSYSWGNWSWSGWNDDYGRGSNFTHLRYCVNPKRSAKICQLDADLPETVVKYRSNRSFLCRWVMRKEVYGGSSLSKLGITSETDLFEAAGCMLRLAMWPTEKLWETLDKSVRSQLIAKNSTKTSFQIGIHFRCGDKSFSKEAKTNKSYSPHCVFETPSKWKGTNFMDDKSLDSPIDHGKCAIKITDTIPINERENTVVFVASDNPESALQIKDTIKWPFVILPPTVCHIDLQKGFGCSIQTTLHWFLLSLSSKIVMQGLVKPPEGSGSMFEDIPDGVNRSHVQGSVSAFSRFAAIYGLYQDSSRYGLGCHPINSSILSRTTQGNWICNSKHLY